MKLPTYLPFLAVLGITSAGALAQALVPSYNNYVLLLGGTTADYQWNGYSAETRPSGVSSGTNGLASQWTAGIAPAGGSSNISVSGNPSNGSDITDFIAASNGGGIYSFFSQTHYQINSLVPLSNMESLVVQIEVAEGLSGMFGGSAVSLVATPTLSLTTTTGTFNLNPNFSLLSSTFSAVVNGSATNIDLFNYQWDFSGVTGTVENYTVNWQMPYHGILFGQDVTESAATHTNDVLVQSVPEPSALVAAGGGCALLLGFRRSRRSLFA